MAEIPDVLRGVVDPSLTSQASAVPPPAPTREWYAATAAGASLRKHLLPARRSPTAPYGSIAAMCGEFRRSWQRVEEFARPDVFEACTGCLRAVGALRRGPTHG
jgi:hypothetical protein